MSKLRKNFEEHRNTLQNSFLGEYKDKTGLRKSSCHADKGKSEEMKAKKGEGLELLAEEEGTAKQILVAISEKPGQRVIQNTKKGVFKGQREQPWFSLENKIEKVSIRFNNKDVVGDLGENNFSNWVDTKARIQKVKECWGLRKAESAMVCFCE